MLQQVQTYEEACQAIENWGILPLSSFIPSHPSLEAVTRPEAWYTSLETDPWLWRDRLPTEGVAAYGRFIAGKPLLVARDLFPLLKCALGSDETIEERYADGLLARSSVRIYELINEQAGIDARELRRQANMQNRSEKNAFDHALIDLQRSADIVISGITARLNKQGKKSGWNSTCYMLAEHWMNAHAIAPLSLAREEAQARIFARLEPRWSAEALRYIRGRIS